MGDKGCIFWNMEWKQTHEKYPVKLSLLAMAIHTSHAYSVSRIAFSYVSNWRERLISGFKIVI